MDFADGLVIIRQGFDHLACLLEFGVHPLDLPLVTRIGELLCHPAQRDIQRLDIALDRQVHLGRCNGGFFNGARHQRGHAGGCIANQISDDLQHRLVEARWRILYTDIQVIVINESLVVRMRPFCASPHHV